MIKDIHIVASGEKWVGYGIRSFSSIIKEIIAGAKEKLVMTVYIISDMDIIKEIRKSLERGISVEIYIYFPHQDSERNGVINEIIEMENKYSYLNIYRIRNDILHAKVLIADGKKILVGSANPTFGGMVKNYELGFLVKDKKIACKVLSIIQRLKKE